MAMECCKVKFHGDVLGCKTFSGNSKISRVTESEIEAKISSHYDNIDDCLDKIDGLKIYLQHVRNSNTENSTNRNEEEKI